MLRRAVGLAAAAIIVAAGCGNDDETATSSGGSGGTASEGGGGQGGAGGNPTTGGSGGSAEGGGGAGGCVNTLPNETVAPDRLSQTGLYSDFATRTLAPYVREFEPQFKLWSDGADKKRWVYLPECGSIDSSDMDNWDFPVGTRMWKQFERNGQLLETRLIHRYGPAATDWLYIAYQWDAGDTDAFPVPNGGMDTKNEGWSIPNSDDCQRCHGPHPAKGGWPSRYLGFSAIQLSHGGPGLTLDDLVSEGALTAPPSGSYTVPGTPPEQAALGYLHANCSNCHNSTPDGIVYPAMDMKLRWNDTDVTQTAAYVDLVNQPMDVFFGHGCNYRLSGMNNSDSCVHLRMSARGNADQMPPLGSAIADTSGLAIIEAWIAILPPAM